MLKKLIVQSLQKLDYGSALSMKLVKLTRKHSNEIHPKHLLPSKVWFEKYLSKNDVVLDLGCGIGQSSIGISTKVKKVIGLDNNSNSLKIAKASSENKQQKNVEFMIFDANKKLPFKDKYFSKVIASDILEHLVRRDIVISEIKRVLKPQGMLFLVVDNPHTSWKKLKKSVGLFPYADLDHKYEYPKAEILKKLKLKGFKVLKVSTVTYDTPLKGVIDLVGGISLTLYKNLRTWRQYMNKKHPEDTTGFTIVAQKVNQPF